VLDGLIKRGDGDNIHAVIWFCDLRNSTPLSETMGRDDFLVMLNGFLEVMADAVLEQGGEVLRYIGDAALAIFPIAEDQQGSHSVATVQAIQAAKNAIKRMHDLNGERAERGENEIGFGIGLHLGDVTYGNIGSPSRLEFTVIGAAANEAARIESLTKTLHKPVLMSESFHDSLADDLTSLGKHSLRGVAGEQEIFTLPEYGDEADFPPK
jgi:adenylate cyclase